MKDLPICRPAHPAPCTRLHQGQFHLLLPAYILHRTADDLLYLHVDSARFDHHVVHCILSLLHSPVREQVLGQLEYHRRPGCVLSGTIPGARGFRHLRLHHGRDSHPDATLSRKC